jgi:hypothetical protein
MGWLRGLGQKLKKKDIPPRGRVCSEIVISKIQEIYRDPLISY